MGKNIVGLTEQEVKDSRSKYGRNSLTKKKKKGFLRRFIESFGDPIIRILLIALGINTIFLFNNSDWFESVGIAVAIFLATFIATLSEYGNESAFEKLQEEASKMKCRVKRANRFNPNTNRRNSSRRYYFSPIWGQDTSRWNYN